MCSFSEILEVWFRWLSLIFLSNWVIFRFHLDFLRCREKKPARYRWFWKKTRLGYSKNRSPSIHGMARVLHSTGLLSPWFWCEQSHDSEWSFRRCFFYHYSRNPDINLPDLTIKHTNYPVILRILGLSGSLVGYPITNQKIKSMFDVGMLTHVVQATKIPLFQTDEDLHNLLGHVWDLLGIFVSEKTL